MIILMKYIKFEAVTISEILPVITSIILLIITLRSLSNAKKGNEITKKSLEVAKQALDLQENQFLYNFKPEIVFDVPSKSIEQSVYNIQKTKQFEFIFHKFFIRNNSKNVCYDISVKTFIYMNNENWDKYYKITRDELKDTSHILSLSSLVFAESLYSLDNLKKLESYIPPFYHYLITNLFNFFPELYVIVKYKDKMGNSYEDCLAFSTVKEIVEESVYVFDFELSLVDSNEVKMNLFEQEEYLENNYGSSGFNYYYDY